MRLLLAVATVAAVAPLTSPDATAATNREAARRAVCSVFGARCAAAMRVVRCETGGTYSRFATGRAGERGLFQIHPIHFGWLNEARLYERVYNARAAFRLSNRGRDWSHWSCKP